jgi:hypothetical protein
MPQPPRHDGWKHTPKPNPAKPAANPNPNTSRKPWQPGAPKVKSTGKKTSRVTKFLFAGLGVGLLTAAVVIVLLYLRPSSYPNIVVVAPDLPDSLALPENAAGVASAKAVEELSDGKARGKASGTLADTTPATPDGWMAKLNVNSKGTVLYFAAHVGADATGPYLWEAANGAARKLYLTAVFDRLAELKGKHKLLVIDISETPPNWAFGGAFNDFVQAVKDLDAKIEGVEDLCVMLSADAGQTAWIADEWQKSAFGHHFTEGLRGAAGQPGGPVTAADLYAHVKAEVQKWAVANREANQEPVLLPKGSGEARAKQMDLATLPRTAYTAPPKPTAVVTTPKELQTEWARVADLAARSPAPDTTDPLKWREYLDCLLRWERLLRVGAAPAALSARATRLGGELAARTADAAGCGGVALPAGPTLSGVTPDPLPRSAFAELWKPPGGPNDRGNEWKKLRDTSGRREDALRGEVARFVLDQVLEEGVNRTSLDTAEAVLGLLAEGLPAEDVLPVEVHYLRMLQRHLPGKRAARTADDVKRWPSADSLRAAVELRRKAEHAAWAEGLAYPEQAVRWTAAQVKKADEDRQAGEDLLFDVDPKSRTEAAALFEKAKGGYAEARRRAEAVADALALRDKVFARLPYYARWAAAAREGPANAAEVVALLERAGRGAHKVDERIAKVSNAPTEDDVKLLKQAADEARAIEAVAKAYDEFAAALGTQAQASNWHALQAVQTVPLRKVPTGPDAGERARAVAGILAGNAEQKTVTRVTEDPAATALKAAERHLRVAAAHLNENPPSASIGAKPVDLADALAGTVRERLPRRVESATTAAAAQDTLRGGAAKSAEANRDARLCDPAAPPAGTPTPPEADRRLWRHFFLLDHAHRVTLDGWCGERETDEVVGNWYCSKAAKLVLDAADAELNRLVPDRAGLPPAGRAKLVVELDAARDRKPTVLQVSADKTRVVVPDERQLRYSFGVKAAQGERFGFPVWEYALPQPLKAANADKQGRRVQRWASADKPGGLATEEGVFKFGTDREKAAAERLAADVLYRGRVYQASTALAFAGPPSLRVEQVPPTGNAVMALEADPEAVSGAITLLIDITKSMERNIPGTRTPRIDEAHKGVRAIIRTMPKGTQLRIVTFVGTRPKNGKFGLVVKPIVEQFKVEQTDTQADLVMKEVEKKAKPDPDDDAESITPVAGAIKYALDPETGAGLWPKNYSGVRSLIVITDGEDNWNKFSDDKLTDVGEYQLKKGGRATPADVVREAVEGVMGKKDAAGVNVFLALFALGEGELTNAKDQFELLQKPGKLPAGGKFQLMPNATEGRVLASQLAQAVMPRVRYQWVKDARVNGELFATLKGDRSDTKGYNTTDLLDPGVYELRAGEHAFPLVQNDAGGRTLLRAEWDNRAAKVKLSRPPIAYELANLAGHNNHASGEKIALTLAELKFKPSALSGRVDAVVTLEDRDPALQAQVLKAASRTYAWIDLIDSDGEPVYAHRPKDPRPAGDRPRVLIRNHLEGAAAAGPRAGHELLAPAWDVQIEQWEKQADPDAFRLPEVRGYWVTGLPKTANRQTVSPGEVSRLGAAAFAPKQFSVDGGQVPVLDAAVEPDESGRPYLWVWMDYQAAGQLVVLRADRKSTEERLGEWHAYYDEHHRYTAKFGPLTDDDLKTGLLMELYTVESLRRHAREDKRQVTREAVPSTKGQYGLPDKLQMAPKAK